MIETKISVMTLDRHSFKREFEIFERKRNYRYVIIVIMSMKM